MNPTLDDKRGDGDALLNCPHCGAAAVNHYRDAYVRHAVTAMDDETLTLDGSSKTVLQYEKGSELVCDECGKKVEPPGRAIEIVSPRLELDPQALHHGFLSTYGAEGVDQLARLPGGDVQSFGEFAEAVVVAAQREWEAISGLQFVSIRLAALFPFGEKLCPMLHVAGREEELAGSPISRVELENMAGIGLGSGTVETATVLCGCAVDSANEMLGRPATLVEIEE